MSRLLYTHEQHKKVHCAPVQNEPSWRALIYILLWLLTGATLLVASVPVNSYASALTYTVPNIAVSVAHSVIQPGAAQRLNIDIDELSGRRTALVLVVDYPNGEIARSLHYADSGQGVIEWTVPSNAGLGEATFRLIADGCTCGEQNTIPLQAAVDGTVEGTFAVGTTQ